MRKKINENTAAFLQRRDEKFEKVKKAKANSKNPKKNKSLRRVRNPLKATYGRKRYGFNEKLKKMVTRPKLFNYSKYHPDLFTSKSQ